MKTSIYASVAAVATLGLALTACTPDEQELGATGYTSDDLVEGIAYSITHDASNPNIIYLKSLLPEQYSCFWTHPQGRTQAREVTLQMPFEGTYSVVFGIETRGGIVTGDAATFTISDFCADFVSNEQWTYLTGGVGKSKKWVPDNGKYGYAAGEMTFANPEETQEFGNWSANWDPGAGYTEMDFSSYMIFDLDGGAHCQVFDGTDSQSGTFMLNTDDHTISFTDCELLHSPGWDNRTSNWQKNLNFFELDENHMRIGILREKATSGEDPWWIIWNFVSEDYANSFVYVAPDVYPTLDADWRDYFEQKTNLEMTWLLNEENAFDWCACDGSTKGVSGIYTPSVYLEDFSLTLHSGLGTYSCKAPGDITVEGTYTLDDDGVYTFSAGLPEFALDTEGKVMFGGNQLRIMNYDVDAYSGKVNYAWLGIAECDDNDKVYQYLAIQLVPKSEGETVERYAAAIHYFDAGWTFQTSSDVYITGNGSYTMTIYGNHGDEPYGLYLDVCKILKKNPNCDIVVTDIKVDGNSIEFDDSDIDRGYGDTSGQENADARRYIVNPWGASANYKDLIPFTSELSVTVQVIMDNGTPFIAE